MNDLAALTKSTKKEKYVDHVDKCQYMGCPMSAAVKDGDGWKCAFHETPDYHQDVTEAINKNMKFIQAYSTMVKWDSDKWIENDSWLKTNINIPMKPNEPYSEYLIRYWKWISEKIKTDSTETINNRLRN